MPSRQNRGVMIDEARAWIAQFPGCNRCWGKAIIVHGIQPRVRVVHGGGCPLVIDMNHRHPELYRRNMGYIP
jgi:hypothetical protein